MDCCGVESTCCVYVNALSGLWMVAVDRERVCSPVLSLDNTAHKTLHKCACAHSFSHFTTQHNTPHPTTNPRYFLNAMTVPDKAHHMAHARTYHSKVLKKAPGNVYAAHGLGLVLAEEFGKVRCIWMRLVGGRKGRT